MHKIIATSFFIYSSLFGYTQLKDLEKTFLETTKILKGNIDKYKKDNLLKKANKYLYNKDYFIKSIIIEGDPESNIKRVKKEVLIPDYKTALTSLYKSTKDNHNPISAFEGLYILQNKYNDNKIIYFKMKRRFAKTLYEKTNNCNGYLNYAKYLSQGIGGRVDKLKAYLVFSEGNNLCEKNYYYKLLFQNNMYMLKKDLGKNHEE